MRPFIPSLLAFSFVITYAMPVLQAKANAGINAAAKTFEEPSSVRPSASLSESFKPSSAVGSTFQPFTGRMTKNKVRLRLQSSYDGLVLRELGRHDLVEVLGEEEDFYAVRPPADFRGYVFRTYVLDDVIEGNRVNIRLGPELEAPVVVQLNSGDRVEGSVSPDHTKWLEIKLPDTARFYLAKEYVEKAGDIGLKARLEKKQEEGYRLLDAALAMGSVEMQKSFERIDIERIKSDYQRIMLEYSEFPELADRGKEGLTAIQEAYTAKKLAYLENQSHFSFSALEANKKLAAELQAQKGKVAHLEQQMERARHLVPPLPAASAARHASPVSTPVPVWLPVEENLFHQWAEQTGNRNPQDFYDEQKRQSFVLRGIIDPYTRPIKNKPGDYMLISAATKLPVAFLYSTHIDLQDYVGQEVAVVVAPRPNHHFAFPAYFVLDLE